MELPRKTIGPTVVGVLILIALLGYGIWKRDFSEKKDPGHNTIAYATIVEQEEGESPAYTLDIEYPQFSGLGNGRDTALNAAIEMEVATQTAAFRSALAEAPAARDAGESTFVGRYEVLSAEPSLVSIAFSYDVYVAGAAHPSSHISTVNWAPQRNARLSLHDILAPRSDALPRLAALARVALQQEPRIGPLLSTEWLASGTSPTEQNYAQFAVAADGLRFYFNPYQVAAGAAGILRVSLPFTEVIEYLNPDESVLRLP